MFDSLYCDLVTSDNNGRRDVFRYDGKTRKIEMMSVSPSGTASAYSPVALGGFVGSSDPAISGNGRFVAFTSNAINLTDDVIPPGAGLNIFVRDMDESKTELITKFAELPIGALPNFSNPSLSDDGRLVTFEGNAALLGLPDATIGPDILVHDRKKGTTTIVSVDSDGNQASDEDDGAYCGAISGNGRFVTFTSGASAYDDRDNNVGAGDAFIHDVRTGKTELVSVASGGERPDDPAPAGNSHCHDHISRDGRMVTFGADGSGMVPNDTNSWLPRNSGFDVFVHDRKELRTERVSVNSYGEEWPSTDPPFSGSGSGSISPDGRYVIFLGPPGLTEPRRPGEVGAPGAIVYIVYIYDRRMFTLEPIAAPIQESQRFCDDGQTDVRSDEIGDVAPGGRHVTFQTCPTALGQERARPSDAHGIRQFDLYLRDRGAPVGAADLGRKAAGYAPVLSGLPGFARNGFTSIVDGPGQHLSELMEGSDITEVDVAYRPSLGDLFFNINVDHMPGPRGGALALAGNPLLLYTVSFVYEGRSYEVRVSKEGIRPRFGLFSCSGEIFCREVTSLRGGYGTVGESVAVSLPLTEIGFKAGSALERPVVFTSLGTYESGTTQILDSVWID